MTSCSARRRETAALGARSRSSKQTSPDDRRSSSGVRKRTRRVAAKPSFQPPREAASALGDPLPSDPFVQVERRRQCPAVLERVETARGQQRSGRPVRGVFAVHPRLVCPAVEARYRRARVGARRLTGPRAVRSLRGPNSHLWQPAANMSQPSSAGDVSSTPKPCTPSTHNSTRSALWPAPVRRARNGGDVAERQLHARRGVDPRHGDATGSRGQRACDRGNHALGATPSPGRRRGGRSGSRRRSSSPPPEATRGWRRSRARS